MFVSRLADQMRVMTFPQWFELLKNVFESFLLYLQRIKVNKNSQILLLKIIRTDELTSYSLDFENRCTFSMKIHYL